MDKVYDPLLKDTLYTETLPNGLLVAVLQKPGYKQTTARFATHYGSVDSRFVDPATGKEVNVPDGIAHFLEHKLFEEEDGSSVSDRFSELGAESNAYTTYTHTVYYFNTTMNFEPCFDLLLDFVQSPHFSEESVVKERGIIEQEIRMYLDDPGWRSSANLLEALYVNHPVRIDIAGTVESIQKIDKDLLYLCHQTFYHPSNMVLFVAGDVDPQQIMDAVKANFAKRTYAEQSAIERIMPEEPPEINVPRKMQQLLVSQPIMRLGFKDATVGLRGKELLAQDLGTAMVMDAMMGRGSSLYTQLYESGLIDQRFGSEYSPEESYGYSYFVAPTRDASELEVRLLDGIAQARANGVPAADFERAKRKTVGRVINLMNDIDSIAFVFIDGYFKGQSLFDLIPVAQSLTLDGANTRLRSHFDPSRSAVSLIYPK
jgi:predicted Zn-dependent peptidase